MFARTGDGKAPTGAFAGGDRSGIEGRSLLQEQTGVNRALQPTASALLTLDRSPCCTPPNSLLLAEGTEENVIDFKLLLLKVGILGAEPWSGRTEEK